MSTNVQPSLLQPTTPTFVPKKDVFKLVLVIDDKFPQVYEKDNYLSSKKKTLECINLPKLQ